MCYVQMIMAAVGIVTDAAKGVQQRKAEQRRLKYQSAIARNNAITTMHKARDAKERGEKELVRHSRSAGNLKAQQVAAFAANGLNLGSGSPLTTLEDTAKLARTDQETIRENTRREVSPLLVQASQFERQSNQLTKIRKDAKKANKKRNTVFFMTGDPLWLGSSTDAQAQNAGNMLGAIGGAAGGGGGFGGGGK